MLKKDYRYQQWKKKDLYKKELDRNSYLKSNNYV